MIITKKVRWRMPMDVVLGWQCLFGGIPLAILAIPELPTLQPVSWMAISAVFYLGICAQGLGNCVWFRIIDMVPAGVAGISSLAVPTVGLIFGAVLLNEVIGAIESHRPSPGPRCAHDGRDPPVLWAPKVRTLIVLRRRTIQNVYTLDQR